MSEKLQKFISQQKLTLMILFGSLNFSMMFFVYLAWSGMLKGSSGDLPLQYFAIGPFCVSLYFHFKMKSPENILHQIQKCSPLGGQVPAGFSELEEREKKLARVYTVYTTYSILTYAMNESIVIFGLVGMIAAGVQFPEFLGYFGTGLALNLFMFPRPDEVFQEVSRRLV